MAEQISTWMYKVCLNTALTIKRNNKRKKNEIPFIGAPPIAEEFLK
jgi:hypothetical protein